MSGLGLFVTQMNPRQNFAKGGVRRWKRRITPPRWKELQSSGAWNLMRLAGNTHHKLLLLEKPQGLSEKEWVRKWDRQCNRQWIRLVSRALSSLSLQDLLMQHRQAFQRFPGRGLVQEHQRRR